MGLTTVFTVSQTINNITALEEEIQNLEDEIVSYAIEINELLDTLNDWQKATGCDRPSDYEMIKRGRDD